jgi:hypothetical protein
VQDSQITGVEDIRHKCVHRRPRRMLSSGMLGRVALVGTDVSEEFSAPIIRVTIIGELGTALALTSADVKNSNLTLGDLITNIAGRK